MYAGVIEHSVYIHAGHRGRGVGAALLLALITSAEKADVWTIQSGLSPKIPLAFGFTSGLASAWSSL